jgi:RHS repeat-associated protein
MGEIYEQLEYTPYGELWVEHLKTMIETTPFRFTGKERDSETGLYYFGARYLNPQTSMWLSADPAMGEYIPQAPVNDEAKKHNENLPGMGGVFNYVNLHAYHYAGNNPVILKDENGRELDSILDDIQNSVDNHLSQFIEKEGTALIKKLEQVHSGRISLGTNILDVGAYSVSISLIGDITDEGQITIQAEVGFDITLAGYSLDGTGAKITVGFRQAINLYDTKDGGYVRPGHIFSRFRGFTLAIDETIGVNKGLNISANLHVRKYLGSFNNKTTIKNAMSDLLLKDLVVGVQLNVQNWRFAYRFNISNWIKNLAK